LIVWRGRRCICYGRTCPLGRLEHPVRPAPMSKHRPAIRARCAAGDSLDGAPGILTLRRFVPDDRCGDVSNVAGLHAVRRSLAPIYFRRGIVRPGGKSNAKKGRAIRESSVRFPGFNSCHRSAPRRFSGTRASADPALGFASLRVSGPDQSGQSSGLDPTRIISLRKPFPAPIRSWVFRRRRTEMNQAAERFVRSVTGLITAVTSPVPSACSRG